MKPFKTFTVGVIGCGMISPCYFRNLCDGDNKRFKIVKVKGCSDIKPERAKQRAEEFGILQMTNEEILNDPEIDIVLNLTNHTSHVEVIEAALRAGKHVYSEKMIAPTFEEGKYLYNLAKGKGLMLCAAPDTFLGSSMQTARRLYDAGLIGEAVAGNAIMVRGYHHERFRTDPERRFAFCHGGGIIFDMGCYYFASLINILGPIKTVSGFSQTRGANERVYMHPDQPHYGEIMKIESPNNTAAILEFESGALVTLTSTSESVSEHYFMIHGTEGQLKLPDCNTYTGDVEMKLKTGDFMPMPKNFMFTEDCRGLGLADMCYAILNNRPPRASGELALHMLEAADAITNQKGNYKMTTTCTRPAPFAQGITEYPEMALDL